MNDMLHNKRRKSKGEKRGDFKDLHARNDARHLDRISGFNRIHRIICESC
jgi:hypothetical protein